MHGLSNSTIVNDIDDAGGHFLLFKTFVLPIA